MCITPISNNAELILLPSFSMASMLSAVVEYQIDELKGVPPIMIRMVRDPIVANYDLSCVKRFASSSAPLSEEIIELLQKKFPGRGFLQGYVREKKARFKALCEVEFIDAVPKSPSGKILRRILRDDKRSGPHGLIVRDRREQARL